MYLKNHLGNVFDTALKNVSVHEYPVIFCYNTDYSQLLTKTVTWQQRIAFSKNNLMKLN